MTWYNVRRPQATGGAPWHVAGASEGAFTLVDYQGGAGRMASEQPSISPGMTEYLQGQVAADEKVLWAGTTDVAARMRRLVPVPVAAVFNILVCTIAFSQNPSWLLLELLSVLFWGGLAVVIAWGHSRNLQRTLYAITNRRALILSVGNPRKTESYPPERIDFVRPVVKKGGRGNLYFTTIGSRRSRRYNHGFLDIADVERVARLMDRVRLRKRR